MRRIRYSVAMSLDGYIAGPNGEYDWIEVDPGSAAGYFKAFYAQFDIALMGRKSYDHAGGGVSPFKTYVLSLTLRPGKRGSRRGPRAARRWVQGHGRLRKARQARRAPVEHRDSGAPAFDVRRRQVETGFLAHGSRLPCRRRPASRASHAR
ncbi:MAG TPA: hypothetical protein VN818_07985 [Gammaproteobacteria bacterium]|nr:hypothetical protein [Gammaproteobacteria bacterium]